MGKLHSLYFCALIVISRVTKDPISIRVAEYLLATHHEKQAWGNLLLACSCFLFHIFYIDLAGICIVVSISL